MLVLDLCVEYKTRMTIQKWYLIPWTLYTSHNSYSFTIKCCWKDYYFVCNWSTLVIILIWSTRCERNRSFRYIVLIFYHTISLLENYKCVCMFISLKNDVIYIKQHALNIKMCDVFYPFNVSICECCNNWKVLLGSLNHDSTFTWILLILLLK